MNKDIPGRGALGKSTVAGAGAARTRPAELAATVEAPSGLASSERRLLTRRQLELRFTELGIRDEDLAPKSNGTIVERQLLDEGDATTAPHDQPQDITPGVVDPTTVVLGALLAGGGMGLVHVAEQPGLRREVAVKRLRPCRRSISGRRTRVRSSACAAQ